LVGIAYFELAACRQSGQVRIFNGRLKDLAMRELLQFSVPITARADERKFSTEELCFATIWAGSGNRNLDGLNKNTFTYRNIITWYLKAAGFSGAAVASYLSISPSRANSLALATRKKIYSGVTIGLMKFVGVKENLSSDELSIHMFKSMRQEMRAAEDALFFCRGADLFVVSGSLRLGRAAYIAAMGPVIDLKCSCSMCKYQSNDLTPYWVEESTLA
jgi:hypothetical protein